MFSYPNEKMSTVLRLIASEYGYFRTTKWYQRKLHEIAGRSCSRQWICSVLGNSKQRERFASKELLENGRKFLSFCGGDVGLAKKVVDYASTTK